MKKRYVATGQTYQHQQTFASWAWHWDAERRAWIEDNGSEEEEPCIQAIKCLPGVRVAIEEDDEGEGLYDADEVTRRAFDDDPEAQPAIAEEEEGDEENTGTGRR